MDKQAESASALQRVTTDFRSGRRQVRILAAGVSRRLRKTMLATLDEAGFPNIIEAGTGCQVLATLAELSGVGVVLMDRSLPDVDGLEVCRRIRECQRWIDVQTLILTDDVDLDTTENIFAAGASDYLTKPLRPGELAARVAKAADLYQERRVRREQQDRLAFLADRYTEFVGDDGGPQGGGYSGPLEPSPARGLDRWTARFGGGISRHMGDWLGQVGPDDISLISRVLNQSAALWWDDGYGSSGEKLGSLRADTLEDKLHLAARVLESTTEGVMITDAHTRIMAVNQGFSAITGYSREEIVGQTPRLLHSGRQHGGFYQRIWRAIAAEGQWSGEIWNRRKNGEVYPEWLSIGPIRDVRGEVQHYVGVFTDISIRKESEARIESLAYYDQLTGLPNRVMFSECLSRALGHAARHGQRLALMTLDLDRFKLINDSLGHAAGDELLRIVRERLESAVRKDDTVARLGGDEFAVLLEGIGGSAGPVVVAQKIQKALAAPAEVKGCEVYATASMGLALYPYDATQPEALMKHADTAMHRAKELGRNNYQFFEAEMNTRSSQRLALETGLRKALDRNEFILYYQPLIETFTGRISGAEALLRWEHPELGLISPESFIPLAEETGLIVPMGEWVLSEACSQARSWMDSGLPPIRLAVNLSARQFRHGNLTDTVPLVLKGASLDARQLELEITEGVLMEHGRETVEMLESFKGMGINVAVDDFGTGYSSLSYLKRFPIDSLKIDRSFVRDVHKDADNAAIVTAITAMAESLNLSVVAEGVETAEQLGFLRDHACHRIQGYYFSEPLAPRAFATFLAAGLPSGLIN